MIIPAHSYGPAGVGSQGHKAWIPPAVVIHRSWKPGPQALGTPSMKAKKDLHGRVLNHEGTKEDMKKVRINKLISAIITYFFYFVTG